MMHGGAFNQSGDDRMPAGEICQNLFTRALFVPRLALPVGLLNHTDEIGQGTTAQAVGHGMPLRSGPHAGAGWRSVLPQRLDRGHRAPGHVAGKARAVRAEQNFAHP